MKEPATVENIVHERIRQAKLQPVCPLSANERFALQAVYRHESVSSTPQQSPFPHSQLIGTSRTPNAPSTTTLKG